MKKIVFVTKDLIEGLCPARVRIGSVFWILFVIGACLKAPLGQAKELKFNDVILDVGDAQKLVISGYKGSVKISPSKQGGKLIIHAKKITDDKKSSSTDNNWIFGAKREDKNIKIEVHGPDMQNLGEGLKQLSTEFQFEIEAPPMPVDLAWRDGVVHIQNWNAALNIVLLEGSLNISHCVAQVHIQNEMGEVKLLNHHGRTEIETLKSKLIVNDFDGHLRIKNFAGESILQNVTASIHLQSKLGASHITKSQGSLEIENGKGSFNILDFNGSIHGQNEDGNVTVKLVGDVDVAMDSVSGSMSFKLPEDTGAYAKLQSEEGTLSNPESFKTGKLGNLKVASGRFSGSEKGSIVLKSKTGNLRVH